MKPTWDVILNCKLSYYYTEKAKNCLPVSIAAKLAHDLGYQFISWNDRIFAIVDTYPIPTKYIVKETDIVDEDIPCQR